ncbi:hypothetical protein UlMin_003208 [Ulmus minor]
MASVHTIAPQSFLSMPKPKSNPIFSRNKPKITWVLNSVEEEYDANPVQSLDSTDQQEGMAVSRVGRGGVESELASQVGGFGTNEGRFSFQGGAEFQRFGSGSGGVGEEIERRESGEIERLIDRTINGTIVLAAGTYAVTRLLTIDRDYWHVSFTDMVFRTKSYSDGLTSGWNQMPPFFECVQTELKNAMYFCAEILLKFFLKAFIAGFRFPFPNLIRDFFAYFGISPSQVLPNFWTILLAVRSTGLREAWQSWNFGVHGSSGITGKKFIGNICFCCITSVFLIFTLSSECCYFKLGEGKK